MIYDRYRYCPYWNSLYHKELFISAPFYSCPCQVPWGINVTDVWLQKWPYICVGNIPYICLLYTVYLVKAPFSFLFNACSTVGHVYIQCLCGWVCDLVLFWRHIFPPPLQPKIVLGFVPIPNLILKFKPKESQKALDRCSFSALLKCTYRTWSKSTGKKRTISV